MPQNTNVFDTTIQKTNDLLAKIESTYEWEDRQNSYVALRAVLHALRDRLPADQAAAFAAQLTLLVKGIFFDGWKPARTPIKMDADKFIARVEAELALPDGVDTADLIQTVITAVADSIEAHEIEKIQEILPDDVAQLLSS